MKSTQAKIYVYLIALLFVSSAYAQQLKVVPFDNTVEKESNVATKSSPIEAVLFKDYTATPNNLKWAVSVRPRFSRKHYSPDTEKIKEEKLQAKIQSYVPRDEDATEASTPIIGTNFEANWSLNGTPPDNSMAISNGGFIVTANNDGVEYYNSAASFLYVDFWFDFFNDNSLTASLYDPKVIYDSGSDRFIMVVLHGTSSTTSKVIVCYSKTNNPSNGWWIYQLTGNPLNDNSWFDYPALGVSNNEIYITGNLFSNAGVFNKSIIYQIPKAAGLSGNSFSWQYWTNFTSTPYPGFSLAPASNGHQGNYGPGIYFVSNRSGGSDKIRLWDLTDDMSGSPQLNSYTVNTTAYSPSPDASQQGTTDKLDNGDCRIQSAFYLNGMIHFAFNSDIGQGWNGLNYNRLTISNTTNQSSTFGLQGSYDYSYPAVASYASNANDKSVMIAFMRSSSSSYPELRVVNCDNNMQWSASTLVKSGDNYVNFTNGDERWGDYIGISRKHNATTTPSIWLAGSYGGDIISQNAYNTWKTWVAEVYATPTVGLEDNTTTNNLKVFPNPSYDLINIHFTNSQKEKTTIELFDLNGKLVKKLYEDSPKAGENRLSFNKGALKAGTYMLVIQTTDKILKNEKIVIMD